MDIELIIQKLGEVQQEAREIRGQRIDLFLDSVDFGN